MGEKGKVKEQYKALGGMLADKGLDIEAVKTAVAQFRVELPSWVFGAFGGGRFGAYMPSGAARNVFEKIDDAALVAKLTGAADRVALHAGWDKPEGIEFDRVVPDDFSELAAYTKGKGLAFGAINPTLFLKGTHFGSLSAPDEGVRNTLINHSVLCCEVSAKYAQGLVTYWLPDGSLYPGQVDLATAEARLRDALVQIYKKAPGTCIHLIEYKLFEPGTYATVIQDAGIAKDLAEAMGDRAGVLVDMGHHAFGVNVAQIVARLIHQGVRGGFHFNTRYAADDDHAVEPGLRMFEIFFELVKGDAVVNKVAERNWAYMIDQCSGLENRVHAVIHSVDSLQISFAKALLVDVARLRDMQTAHDIIRANRTLLDAFLTDVRPIVAMARIENGGEADPVEAYVKSGYQDKINKERG